MVDKIKNMFSDGQGLDIYNKALSVIEKYKMNELMQKGTLVGLSGGADSVMLLCFLVYYRSLNGHFPITAVHVNHCIRGAEADRDEDFSRTLSESLGVEFISKRMDVPSIARGLSVGLEEAARNARYSCFEEIKRSRNDIAAVAVAHNSTDNLETVLLNLMRGAGISGMCGIPPMRDFIVRPLLTSSKASIVEALSAAKIPFVTDSTNLSSEYSRNYIRNNIFPMLSRLSDRPDEMVCRMTESLRSDDDYINSVALDFLRQCDFKPSCEMLSGLHNAVFARTIKLMCDRVGCRGVERVHIENIGELLDSKNFSCSLPGKFKFLCEYGACSVVSDGQISDFSMDIQPGENFFDVFFASVILSDVKDVKTSLNVYNFSIQAALSSAIIDGRVFVRKKKDGDSYRYGGITHKLKKLFNDKKIPPSLRERIPVFCDSKGILWVPGFGVRDDGVKSTAPEYLTLYLDKDRSFFYVPDVNN